MSHADDTSDSSVEIIHANDDTNTGVDSSLDAEPGVQKGDGFPTPDQLVAKESEQTAALQAPTNESTHTGDSLVDVKAAMLMAPSQGVISGPDPVDSSTRGAVSSVPHPTVTANSLLDAKNALAAARRGHDTPSVVPTAKAPRTSVAVSIGRSDSPELPSSDDYSENADRPFPTLATAQLVLDSTEDARARVIRETREEIIAATARAEPVDMIASTHGGAPTRRRPPASPQRPLTVRAVVGLIVVLCVIAGVIVVSLTSNTPSAIASAPTTIETPTPTAAPLVVLEDGRIAFTSTEQLYTAVDAYYKELRESDSVSNTSDVSIRHGYPIGTWDVSRLSDFSRVFDPARKQGLDPDRNPNAQTSFDEDLSGWDTSMATTMAGMFAAATEFTGQGLDMWDVSRVTDFSLMFFMAQSFIGNLTEWNTESAVYMNGMFHRASLFNGDLSRFDVSRVSTMYGMFWGARAFTGGDLTQWNVSSVVNMKAMFLGAAVFDGNVSHWDTSTVENMDSVFDLAETFNGDLSAWDVSSVLSFQNLFNQAINFEGGDLTRWNISRVTRMDYVFARAAAFSGDISTWDVSKVISFVHTFEKTSFNGDLSQWDMGNAEDTARMFYDNRAFSGDVSMWNMSKLKKAPYMFWDSNSFNGDVSHWDVSNLMDARGMFYQADEFNQSLCEWAGRLPVDADVFDMFNATSCDDENDPTRSDDGTSLVGPFCAVCD